MAKNRTTLIERIYRRRKEKTKMSKKTVTIIFVMVALIVGPMAGITLANTINTPTARHITIKAKQFGYDPGVIKVNKGDTVTIDVDTEDVTHGFFLDGYDINLVARPAGDPAVATFVADKTGRFSFRCNQTCGVFHPFMSGVLIVEPNYLWPGSVGLAVGVGVAALIILMRKGDYDGQES